MNELTLADFPKFFRELYGRDPYDWQCRLAKQVVDGIWPGAIDLPTGSGKTSCLDIAIFALACSASHAKEQRTAPRRIFFCVNRRVIVDEAHQRAVRIAARIAEAEGTDSVLGRVAASLRTLSTLRRESAPPLDVLELRGGIYRDNRWARSVTQPTIICTTIDQLGSRLLFRGYGVSPNAAPVQAALIAYDSVVLLDEAHISRPFLQSLDFVKRYLDPEKWAEKSIGVKPMVVVPMTATPPEGVSDADVIRLVDKDRENEGLNNRLRASKKAKLQAVPDVAAAAVTEATSLANGILTAIGIIVNRVATAKAVYEKLREANNDKPDIIVELVIGSMRPTDRDRQAERLRQLVGPNRPPETIRTSFVVATQCLGRVDK
jgi:CRISPR-associated endonuclease/helicase Cas3